MNRYGRRWAIGWAAVLVAMGLGGLVLARTAALPDGAALRTLVPLLLLVVVLSVVVTSPAVARRLGPVLPGARSAGHRPRRGRRLPDVMEQVRGGTPLEAETFAGMVRALDDGELCQAWRESHEVLGYTHLPELRSQLVALRQAYLDEMERRDPRGFAAWLEGGAAAAPERFLATRRRQQLE